MIRGYVVIKNRIISMGHIEKITVEQKMKGLATQIFERKGHNW